MRYDLDDCLDRAEPGRPCLRPRAGWAARLKARLFGLTLLGLLLALAWKGYLVFSY